MRSKVYVPIVVLLMIFSFHSSTLSENLNSNEEILEPYVISETSEDTQWTTGFVCPVEDDGVCSNAIQRGTDHNDWLERLLSTPPVNPFGTSNPGNTISAYDVAVLKTGHQTMIDTYSAMRPFFVEQLTALVSDNDLPNMTTFEQQQVIVLHQAEWLPEGVDAEHTSELLDLTSELRNIVRNAAEGDDSEGQFESELESIFDSRAFNDSSNESKQRMVEMYAVYHASDWYFDDSGTDGRAAPRWLQKVGDFFAGVAAAAGQTWAQVQQPPIDLGGMPGELFTEALGSFGSEIPGSGSGSIDLPECTFESWRHCAAINIVTIEDEPISVNVLDLPDGWTLTSTDPISDNGSEGFGFWWNENGIYWFRYDSPTTCSDFETQAMQDFFDQIGTTGYICWDFGNGNGGMVMAMAEAQGTDVEVTFATPDGTTPAYSGADLFAMGILRKETSIDSGDWENMTKSNGDWISCQCQYTDDPIEGTTGYYTAVCLTVDYPNCDSCCSMGKGDCADPLDADLEEKSAEEVSADSQGLPGFTLLPLLAALGAAMLFSRKKHLGN